MTACGAVRSGIPAIATSSHDEGLLEIQATGVSIASSAQREPTATTPSASAWTLVIPAPKPPTRRSVQCTASADSKALPVPAAKLRLVTMSRLPSEAIPVGE